MAFGKKFADVVVARFTKKPGATAAAPEPEEPEDESTESEGDEEEEESNPGEKGKIALAASRRNNPEAFEEAIKSMVHECLEEYGLDKK